MNKTIFFLIPTQVGGAEIISGIYSKQISATKKTCNVFVGKNSNSIRPIGENNRFIKVNKLKFSALKLYKLLKKENLELVFTSLHGIGIPLLLANYFYKKGKIIIRQSFMPNRYKNNSLTTLTIRLLYPNAYKLVAQTPEMKEMMINYYNLKPEKITVLNNPINYEEIQRAIKEENPFKNIQGFKFVTVGNIRHIKGYDILIKAFKRVSKQLNNSTLHIIGNFSKEDPYYIELKKYIEENELHEKIIFTGYSKNPYKYIYNADCFVLPSRSEGLPNVLLEAIYLKKPVVATKCIPFIEQVISDGLNGFTIDIENEIQMAEGMLKAIKMQVKETNNYNPATIADLLEIFQ